MNLSTFVTWLDCHSGAIQALSSVLGLAGLAWYCLLTLGIRRASVRQANASIRPFIVVDELTENDVPDFRMSLLIVSKKKIFIIRNLGNGPAVNIQWTRNPKRRAKSTAKWISLGDLAVGDWSHIPDKDSQLMFDRPEDGMIFRFSDIAENQYETVEEYRNGIYYQSCKP